MSRRKRNKKVKATPIEIANQNLLSINKKISSINLEISRNTVEIETLESELKLIATKNKHYYEKLSIRNILIRNEERLNQCKANLQYQKQNEERKLNQLKKKDKGNNKSLNFSTSKNEHTWEELKEFVKQELSETAIQKPIKKETKKQNTGQSIIFCIDWANITYDNGKIFIPYKNPRNLLKWEMPNSRKSYNEIRDYFYRWNLEPLQIEIINNKIQKVVNINEIDKVLKLLEIYDYSLSNIASVNDISDNENFSISITEFNSIYSKYTKNFFISELMKMQDTEMKIVVTPELIMSEAMNVIDIHDSFLYSFQKNNLVKIIWESIEENKATYLFQCGKQNYTAAIQLISSYIRTNKIRNKRWTLIYNKKVESMLKNHIRISHTDKNLWAYKIKSL